MRRILTVAMATGAIALCAQPVQAQTAQRFSIQGSGLFTGLFGTAFDQIKDGIGGEAQLRYTWSAWSVGGGIQYTRHDMSADVTPIFPNAQLLGFFVEPRRVIDAGSERYAPYLSARFAISTMDIAVASDAAVVLGYTSDIKLDLSKATGPTINGGGGVLIRLSNRANLDVGVTYGFTKFRDATITATNATTGASSSAPGVKVGSGTNAVVRVGLAIGLGG